MVKILSPKFCLHCFNYNQNYFCQQCLKTLKWEINFSCLECGQRVVNKCRIKAHSNLIKFLISFGDYENEFLKSMILLGKDGSKEIFEDFGYLIANYLKNFNGFHLTFVPLTFKKYLQRGFNQSEVLAKGIAKNLNFKIFSGLIKIKDTKDQAELNSEQRLTNLANAFSLKEKPPKKIIIIDDIKTTGATLKECARVLKNGGAQEIIALTILR